MKVILNIADSASLSCYLTKNLIQFDPARELVSK